MKSIALVLLTVLAASGLLAQPREGKHVELSLSGGYQHYSSDNSDGTSAFLLSPRVGVFLIEGLELEPEFTLMTVSQRDPVYLVNGNVSYNFRTAGKSVPFLLIGYGISNTVPVFNVPMVKSDFSIGVLNLGAGVKIFITDDVAVRLEYRYQNFTGESEPFISPYYSYTSKVDVRLHTVQFGLSVLL